MFFASNNTYNTQGAWTEGKGCYCPSGNISAPCSKLFSIKYCRLIVTIAKLYSSVKASEPNPHE